MKRIRARDRHHVIPKVRCRTLQIPHNFDGNVVKVLTAQHRAWHILFANQTPEEAIETIKREWSLTEEAQAEFNKLCRQSRTDKAAKLNRQSKKGDKKHYAKQCRTG